MSVEKSVFSDVELARRDVANVHIAIKEILAKSNALLKGDRHLLARSRAQIANARDHFKQKNAPDSSHCGMLERSLEQAKRHAAMGEKHIARQRALIAQFERDGHETSYPQRLLELFEELQAMHIAHRDRLARRLDITVWFNAIAHGASQKTRHEPIPYEARYWDMKTRPSGGNSLRVQQCMENASCCQRKAAAAAADYDVQMALAHAAQGWRDLAKMIKNSEQIADFQRKMSDGEFTS